jgi:hypothetical protein
MIELLQFLYPQFQCTINYENVTILLILGRSSIDMSGTSLFWSWFRREKTFGSGPGTTLPISSHQSTLSFLN